MKMKKTLQLSLPTLVSVAATRGMLGLGAGLLLAPKIGRKRRRVMGLALLGVGLASTLPIAARVFAPKAGPVPVPAPTPTAAGTAANGASAPPAKASTRAADDPGELASRALQSAKAYVAAQRYDIAREKLQKIIQAYPNTAAAAEAQAQLDQIKDK